MLLSGHVYEIVASIREFHIDTARANYIYAPINIHSTARMTLKYRFEQYTQRRVLIVGECGGQFPEIMSAGDPIFCILTQRVFYREKLRVNAGIPARKLTAARSALTLIKLQLCENAAACMTRILPHVQFKKKTRYNNHQIFTRNK